MSEDLHAILVAFNPGPLPTWLTAGQATKRLERLADHRQECVQCAELRFVAVYVRRDSPRGWVIQVRKDEKVIDIL